MVRSKRWNGVYQALEPGASSTCTALERVALRAREWLSGLVHWRSDCLMARQIEVALCRAREKKFTAYLSVEIGVIISPNPMSAVEAKVCTNNPSFPSARAASGGAF
jgi:hypothetical protein